VADQIHAICETRCCRATDLFLPNVKKDYSVSLTASRFGISRSHSGKASIQRKNVTQSRKDAEKIKKLERFAALRLCVSVFGISTSLSGQKSPLSG
jgi:hypothetical protein